MMIEKPIWWDWLEYDEEEGEFIGLKPDTPAKIVKEYRKHLKEKDQLNEELIKL